MKTKFEPIPQEAEYWGKVVLDSAFEVHTILGPGFVERVYEDAMGHEFPLRNASLKRQKVILVGDGAVSLG